MIQTCLTAHTDLYTGFERNWSTYKVMQIVAKIVIATTVVFRRTVRGSVDNAVDYAKKNNWILNPDRSLRFMGFVVVVHGTNLLLVLVMALAILMGLRGDESFRIRTKQTLGRLSFSDTTRGIAEVPAEDVIMKWNVENEAKHRVWQTFCRSSLLEMAAQDESMAEEDHEETDTRMDETERVKSTERLAQLEDSVSTLLDWVVYVVLYPFSALLPMMMQTTKPL
ncbi:hypothetical protein ON010_g9970 [Phytophthora cinnamomi]|nr:hypothetical protein ON010_g9970 [Phytophthora cinnamomi]